MEITKNEITFTICDECGQWDRGVGHHALTCSQAPEPVVGRPNTSARLPRLDPYGNELPPRTPTKQPGRKYGDRWN